MRPLAAALALLLAALAPAAPARADALADSAAALRARVRVDGADAEARARHWLAKLEQAAAPDSARARALDVLTDVLLENGHWGDDAPAIGERAVRAWQRARGDSSAAAGASMITLARLLYRRGELDPARTWARAGLDLCERTRGPRDRDVYRGLRYLANIEEERADFAAASELYRRSIAAAESLYGREGAEYGNALNSLGVMDRKIGRWSEARALYREALAIRERALGPTHRDLVFNLNNLANLLSTMGDPAAGRALLQRDLALVRNAYGPRHPYVPFVLTNLAAVEAEDGDTTAALADLREALAIGDSVLGARHASLGIALNDLGALELATGDTARARPHLLRGLAIREAAYGPDHPEVARSLEVLGNLALASDDAAAAVAAFQRARAIHERATGADHPDLAESLADLARAHRAQGDDAAALEEAVRAERIATDHLRLTARGVEERLALRYARTRPSGLDLVLTLAAEHPDDAGVVRRAWDTLVRSRALVMDEMARRHHAVVTSADPLARALADSLGSASEQLAGLLASGSDAVVDSARRARIAALWETRERLELALAARSAHERGDSRRALAGYDSVAVALGPRDALVAFARYAHVPRRGIARGAARYLAFVRGPAGVPPRVIALGEATTLEPPLREWLAALATRPSPLGRAAAERRCRDAGARVRARVWDPLQPACAGAARVLVVPDGLLQRAPFAALPAPRGGFEAEHGPPIHLLGAERDAVAADPPDPPGRGLLVVAAPEFDRAPRPAARGSADAARERGAQSACEAFRSLRFAPLPGAREEAADVGRRWSGACADRDVRTLVGDGADERSLRALAPGHRVLHLATHGFLLDAACARRDRLDSLALEDPLLRAGVALAGANLRDRLAAGDDDGILTAAEVSTLDLEGVEWAVLSTCESGAGEIQDGEGVLGLRRGFAIAGVHTLVSSLWAVADDATERWMDALYGARFGRHLGAAEAVQQAQRAVLRERRAAGESDHPYYWAAFVAAGDWR